MPALCTIGYQQASLSGFLVALRAACVKVVLDVRDVPNSRRPEFRKRALGRALGEAGISYLHLAGLGNPPSGRNAARAARIQDYHAIYLARLADDVGQRHLARATAVAGSARSCLLCYEADWHHCHRSLVAPRIAGALGLAIVHLTVGG